MKPLILSTGLLLLLLTGACQSEGQTAEQQANPLQGTWKIVYQRVSTPDTTVEHGEQTPPSRKVLNATHFATGRQTGENSISAVGGRYIYDGSTYTEIIQYHFIGALVGDTITFDTQLKGDTIWTISGTIGDTLELEETWRRVE